ncbi:MAG: YjgP/YjgQ family permease [Candidatus Omnitrophica bacterium]|nr:YjgP/YjgQ family permease [Candidatus Omnitrophota bacterium]
MATTSILNRYISREFANAFFLSIAVFTFVLLVGNFIKLAELIINKGVAFIYIAKLFFYLIPYLLSYTVPMAMLTATLISFGRLSSDNEITAMRSLGISVMKIASPVLVLGFLVSLLLVPLNNTLIANSHFASRRTLKEIGIRSPSAYIEAGTFVKDFEGYIIFVHEVKGNKLKNIRIYQPQKDGPTRTITASEGEFITAAKKEIVKLKLINGTSEEPDLNNPSSFYKLNFKTYYMTLNLQDKPKLKKLEKKAREMSIKEIRAELKAMRKGGIEPEVLLSELHKKFAMSFSAFLFVLIGIPLAIKAHRSEKSIGIGISFALLVIYWVLLAGGTAFALKGSLAPWIAIWLANIAIGITGAILLFNIMKR